MKKITVVGAGYVGLSLSILLAQNNKVTIVDIDKDKINKVNKNISPIIDDDIQDYLSNKKLNLFGTLDKRKAFMGAEYVVIATPTDYDPQTNCFNTSSVESVIEEIISFNSSCAIVIKSTVPVGFTKKIRKKYSLKNIFFSPEFLREGKALKDNLYPSRIIVGESSDLAKKFSSMLIQGALLSEAEITTLCTDSTEAEAIKLFSNTYLALRVSYFNELDTFCQSKGLNSKQIIDGVSLDPRVGDHYNNPSFGYGGYCLPKDTKQLLANYSNIPNKIISAIVESNETRKDYIADTIIKRKPKIVGIHRLVMKEGSENFRDSAILGVMSKIKGSGIKVIIYEPFLHETNYLNSEVINNLEEFKAKSDIIMANRMSDELEDVKTKIYTRDLYNNN